MRRLAVLLSCAIAACGPVETSTSTARRTPPATPGSTAVVLDPQAGRDLDGLRPVATPLAPSAVAIGERAAFVTSTGARIEGELVHRYDHRPWWTNPSDELTYAIFDEQRFAPWPDDRRIRFVPGSTLVEAFALDDDAPGWRASLRQHDLVMARPPLDGVLQVVRGHDGYHLEENGGGDFAWDLVRTTPEGLTWQDDGLDNDDYLIFGDPIVLPIGGLVVDAFDALPDNPPGVAAEVSDAPPCGTNNCVGLHLGGQLYLYLLHLEQGSIPDDLTVGVSWPAGTSVGRVGNSGVSYEPHLHLSLLFYDEEGGRSWSVPMEFRDLHVRARPGDASRFMPLHDPATGEDISSQPF